MRWLRAMTARGPARLSGASSVSRSGGPSTVFSLPAGIFWILVVEPESMRRYLARAGLRVHATDISGAMLQATRKRSERERIYGPSDLRAEGAGGSRASERTRPIRRSHFKFRCDQLREGFAGCRFKPGTIDSPGRQAGHLLDGPILRLGVALVPPACARR